MKPAIYAHEIFKGYGTHSVLKGLSLSIESGETLVILGRSGVGKSVLLKLIMGFERPDSGYIMVQGRMQSHISEVRRHSFSDLGILFQSSALFDSLTIEENVAFPLTCYRGRERFGMLRASEIQERVSKTLALVGLEGIETQMPSELSGGMRRRAALARLLVYRPTILLYDEPTTGLDPVTSMQISELIATIQKELNGTSIVVTHDLQCALHVADRLALHHEGRIAAIDETTQFLKNPNPLVQQFLKPALGMVDHLAPMR